MDRASPYDSQESNDSRVIPEGIARTQVQLTQEELRILRECNKESFYYRCLPFALFGMGATYYAVKRGYLSGHSKFGPAVKMTGAAFAGWVIGKFSYKGKCEDKFLNLENSTIGKAVRKKRGYVIDRFDSGKGELSYDDGMTIRDRNNALHSSGDFHSSSGSLNFDRNQPSIELDDRERPTIDSEQNISDDSLPMRQFTSYDELRKRNREEYEKQQYRQSDAPRSESYRRPWSSTSEPSRRTNVGPQADAPKNIYGDTWDNPKFS